MSAPDKKSKTKGKKAPRKAKPKAAKTTKRSKPAAPKKERPKKVARQKPALEKPAEVKPAPAERRIEPAKLGPAPSAVVSSRHLGSPHERPGRGFSFEELDSAGVPVSVAKRGGLSIDVRRRSVIDGNVEALRRWVGKPA